MRPIDTMNDRARLVTSVMFALRYHGPELIEMLFANSTDDYKLEWTKRDEFNFWNHLDLNRRRRVLEWADKQLKQLS